MYLPYSIDIKNAVTEAMNKCATTLGVENFNRFVTQNIDGSLFGELKQTLAWWKCIVCFVSWGGELYIYIDDDWYK